MSSRLLEGESMAEGLDGLPFVRSSEEWGAYLERNAVELRTIPWESGAAVTDAELSAIATSLRGLELGETSDRSHLLVTPHHYASAVGDPDFIDAVRLFIAKEQRHGGALDLAGIFQI